MAEKVQGPHGEVIFTPSEREIILAQLRDKRGLEKLERNTDELEQLLKEKREEQKKVPILEVEQKVEETIIGMEQTGIDGEQKKEVPVVDGEQKKEVVIDVESYDFAIRYKTSRIDGNLPTKEVDEVKKSSFIDAIKLAIIEKAEYITLRDEDCAAIKALYSALPSYYITRSEVAPVMQMIRDGRGEIKIGTLSLNFKETNSIAAYFQFGQQVNFCGRTMKLCRCHLATIAFITFVLVVFGIIAIGTVVVGASIPLIPILSAWSCSVL